MGVPYYHFSPLLSEEVPLDCKEEDLLDAIENDTQAYIEVHRWHIKQLARLLERGGSKINETEEPIGVKRGAEIAASTSKEPKAKVRCTR